MRLWSIHPQYLDTKGLTAVWREALLARAVLKKKTKGYTNHPQLIRFKEHPEPINAINAYLAIVFAESVQRGYNFNIRKLPYTIVPVVPIMVTRGQIDFEWEHLQNKLKKRALVNYTRNCTAKRIKPHPLFKIKPGPRADWEKTHFVSPVSVKLRSIISRSI